VGSSNKKFLGEEEIGERQQGYLILMDTQGGIK
jgi:hypothetical protein